MSARVKYLNSLLIKPAGPDCNLDCTYCFYLEKSGLYPESKIHRMSIDTLEILTKQALEQSASQISFAWQGGEPTLMGLPFFQKAIEFQDKYKSNKTITNAFQTNGILIDKEWAAFFRNNNFLIGISIDGPQFIHDKYRYNLYGKGSWQKVVDSIKILFDQGTAVNALTVVNNYSADYPTEIYSFLKELGFTYMQFIPCVEADSNDKSIPAGYSVSDIKYGEFLTNIFDLWLADFKNSKPTTSIRYFDSVFHKYIGMASPDCTLARACGSYLTIEHNGDVYSCDFFVENKWNLGNINSHKLIDMLNSPKQNKFGNMKADVHEECKSCKWLWNCWGGCTKDRTRYKNIESPNHFCKSYKIFFEHADEKLIQLASLWKSSNRQNFIKETVDSGVSN